MGKCRQEWFGGTPTAATLVACLPSCTMLPDQAAGTAAPASSDTLPPAHHADVAMLLALLALCIVALAAARDRAFRPLPRRQRVFTPDGKLPVCGVIPICTVALVPPGGGALHIGL